MKKKTKKILDILEAGESNLDTGTYNFGFGRYAAVTLELLEQSRYPSNEVIRQLERLRDDLHAQIQLKIDKLKEV
jgi:hypothetical protein